jgi:trehalose 6-phosphate synthase
MRKYLLYAGASVLAVVIIVLALSPLSSTLIEDWSRRDVQTRSKLIFNSIQDYVTLQLSEGRGEQLVAFFEKLTEDEKLLAIGYCDEAGALRYSTKLMPASFSCEKLARTDTLSFSSITSDGRDIITASFPIGARSVRGHLAVLHDLGFVETRAAQARLYWILAISAAAIGLGALGTFFVSRLLRQWQAALRRTISEARSGIMDTAPSDRSLALLGTDIHNLVRDLRSQPAASNAIHVDWSPSVLRNLLKEELPDAEVIVVSNREPYIHNHIDGGVVLQTPASGLVAALEPIMRACGGTWIAHGSGSADRDTVDKNDRIHVPPDAGTYWLRRVWLSDEEQAGYYYGFANEGLWPLCHLSFVRPSFREADWHAYRAVNERFADAIVKEAKGGKPIVLVQDYHFALLPRMLRERLPGAMIVTFWHIPWPNPETFSICPWKMEIIRGLLGSSVLGFHTQFHCNNFLETVDRFVESLIDRERASVTLAAHETIVRPYPISIEWPPAALAGQKPIPECRKSVRKRFGLGPEIRLAVGVERFDYTKGILDRLRGVDELLSRHPEWRGRFVLIQAAAPTRSRLRAYRNLQDEADKLTRSINEKHGDTHYQPIKLVVRHHEPEEVFELFRAAEICIVSSLHDGMNLVAKEFVAARSDEQGVLILSHFAGASRELYEALIVNPYDCHALGEVLHEALTMSKTEQQARMSLMRTLIKERNVYRWAGQMLLDAAALRRRLHVIDLMSQRHLHAQV